MIFEGTFSLTSIIITAVKLAFTNREVVITIQEQVLIIDLTTIVTIASSSTIIDVLTRPRVTPQKVNSKFLHLVPASP